MDVEIIRGPICHREGYYHPNQIFCDRGRTQQQDIVFCVADWKSSLTAISSASILVSLDYLKQYKIRSELCLGNILGHFWVCAGLRFQLSNSHRNIIKSKLTVISVAISPQFDHLFQLSLNSVSMTFKVWMSTSDNLAMIFFLNLCGVGLISNS